MRNLQIATLSLLAIVYLTSGSALAQTDDGAWSRWAPGGYRIITDITYLTANNVDLKVDVYRPRYAEGPLPTVIYIHGGGWVGGSKEASAFQLLPYLEQGWAAVNVQYRLARVSQAPAAVEDSRCALQWVAANAEQYGFDMEQLVVTGNSAGGHLSLTTGMLDSEFGLDRQCPGSETPGVAAIVNWYGITDVGDLLEGDNQRGYAVRWLGSQPDRFDIAARVSPLNMVNPNLPPIITIHGDADTVVPYNHAVRLHEALDEANVTNELITVPGGGHGGFTLNEYRDVYQSIFDFLDVNL